MRPLTSPPVIVVSILAMAFVGNTYAETLDREVAADPHGAVEISNVSGKIEVSGWNRPNVHVQADYGGGVERVEVTTESGRTVIRVVLQHSSWWGGGSGGSADLKVQLPKDSKLDVSGVSSGVSSTGIDGPQHLRTVSGGITADIGGTDVDVKTVSGEIRLRGVGQQGSIHLSAISGDISLEHAAGDLEASTVSGSVDVHVNPARSVRLHTTSGSVSFEGTLLRGASLDAQSLSGRLRVQAPAQAGYQYEASSFSGSIRDCFNAEPERTGHYGPGSSLNGTLGEGGAQVRLKTLSGSIELCNH